MGAVIEIGCSGIQEHPALSAERRAVCLWDWGRAFASVQGQLIRVAHTARNLLHDARGRNRAHSPGSGLHRPSIGGAFSVSGFRFPRPEPVRTVELRYSSLELPNGVPRICYEPIAVQDVKKVE